VTETKNENHRRPANDSHFQALEYSNMQDYNKSEQPEPSTNLNPWLAYGASVAGNGHWPITVTFFKDKSASSKDCEDLTLPDLRDRIAKTPAKTKSKLPWLKLAIFGDKPNKKGCLRYNANVLEVSGAEADYDSEQIAFDTAVATIEQAGI